MELSDARLDEILKIIGEKTEDEAIEWIELQPDKDLINEYLSEIVS